MPLPGPGLRLPSRPPSLLPPSSRSRCFHLHTQSGAFFLEGKSDHCPSPARSPSEATTVLRPVPPPRKRRFAGRLLSCARGVPSPFSGSPSPHTAVTGNSWGSFLLLPWHGCSRPWTPNLSPPISLSWMRPPLGRQHEGPLPPRASWASHSYPITAGGPPPVITPFIMGCTSPPTPCRLLWVQGQAPHRVDTQCICAQSRISRTGHTQESGGLGPCHPAVFLVGNIRTQLGTLHKETQERPLEVGDLEGRPRPSCWP